MPGRREEVLDAAVRLLGIEGPRGLTHRAVDRAQGLPLGSTANLFSRRADLLTAVVEHMKEADRAQWGNVAADGPEALPPGEGGVGPDPADVAGDLDGAARGPGDIASLARMLAGFVLRVAEPHAAQLQRARFYLQLEMPQETAAANQMFRRELGRMVVAAGGSARQVGVLMATLDGLMLRAVTYGAEAMPSEEEIGASLRLLMEGG